MDKELLKRIVKSWGKASVYYVGGCVRDMMLGIKPKDYDLCIDLENGATEFTDYLKQEWGDVCSGFTVFPKYGTAKFDLLGEQVECVMPRRESYNTGPRKPDQVEYAGILEDSRRRDFCCNALYQNVVSGVILDPTEKGREDIERRLLRTPINGEQTFIDDPLRMLRAFRFAYQKGFTISEETLETITDYPEYYKLSMERVWSEFSKILVTERVDQAIRDLHKYKLLGYIIPELESSWGMNQNSKFHNLDFTEHTLKVVHDVKPDLICRTAALFHDIGKTVEHGVREDGTWSYFGHEKKSGEMARSILGRLKCSTEFIESVCLCIENHMILKQSGLELSRKQVRKAMRILGDNLENTLSLIDADNNAHAPEYCIMGQVSKFREIMNTELEKPAPLKSPISGRTIMERLGIQEGREVGEVKEIIQSWYDENRDLNIEEAIEKYRKHKEAFDRLRLGEKEEEVRSIKNFIVSGIGNIEFEKVTMDCDLSTENPVLNVSYRLPGDILLSVSNLATDFEKVSFGVYYQRECLISDFSDLDKLREHIKNVQMKYEKEILHNTNTTTNNSI